MKDVTFFNVTITVRAQTEKGAYQELCDCLSGSDILEFTTDTYSSSDENVEKDVEDLIP